MNSAAERLKFARNSRGLSQAALGALVGAGNPDLCVTGGCIAQIERGFRGGGRDLWRRLAVALGTSTDWLLDGVGRPPAASGTHQASVPAPRPRAAKAS